MVDHSDSFEARVVVDPDQVVRVERYGPGAGHTRKRMTPHERRERILDALGDDELSARELAAALDWPAPTVRATLRDMVEEKLVKRTSQSSKSPQQRYRA